MNATPLSVLLPLADADPAITDRFGTLEFWLDGLALLLVLFGAVLCLTAAIGLLRFRDVPMRLHAATKPQVLGLISICAAIALSQRAWSVLLFLVPIVLIQLATAPLSAHMLGRQAYRNGTVDERALYVDEFANGRRTPPGERD